MYSHDGVDHDASRARGWWEWHTTVKRGVDLIAHVRMQGRQTAAMHFPSRMKFFSGLWPAVVRELLAGALVWKCKSNAWAGNCGGQVFAWRYAPPA